MREKRECLTCDVRLSDQWQGYASAVPEVVYVESGKREQAERLRARSFCRATGRVVGGRTYVRLVEQALKLSGRDGGWMTLTLRCRFTWCCVGCVTGNAFPCASSVEGVNWRGDLSGGSNLNAELFVIGLCLDALMPDLTHAYIPYPCILFTSHFQTANVHDVLSCTFSLPAESSKNLHYHVQVLPCSI